MTIYLKLTSEQKETIKNIYDLLYFGFNQDINWGKFVATYHDPECKLLQCHVARRSFDDLLSMCNTYFNHTSEEDLARCIVTLYQKLGVAPTFCPDIKMMVFRIHGKLYAPTFGSKYDHTKSEKGKSNYSYNDVFQKLEEDGTI